MLRASLVHKKRKSNLSSGRGARQELENHVAGGNQGHESGAPPRATPLNSLAQPGVLPDSLRGHSLSRSQFGWGSGYGHAGEFPAQQEAGRQAVLALNLRSRVDLDVSELHIEESRLAIRRAKRDALELQLDMDNNLFNQPGPEYQQEAFGAMYGQPMYPAADIREPVMGTLPTQFVPVQPNDSGPFTANGMYNRQAAYQERMPPYAATVTTSQASSYRGSNVGISLRSAARPSLPTRPTTWSHQPSNPPSQPTQSAPSAVTGSSASPSTAVPYHCKVGCGMAFETISYRTKHEKTHLLTHEREYPCTVDDTCPLRFNDTRDRKKHERKHTGERPYKCQYCEKSFKRTDSRKRHEDKYCAAARTARAEQENATLVGAGGQDMVAQPTNNPQELMQEMNLAMGLLNNGFGVPPYAMLDPALFGGPEADINYAPQEIVPTPAHDPRNKRKRRQS